MMQATAGSGKSPEDVVWDPSLRLPSYCRRSSHQMKQPEDMMLREDLSFGHPTTSDLNRNSLSLSLYSPVPCMDGSLKQTSLNLATDSIQKESLPQARTKKCLTKEFFTCFALSSIVIGLPVAIIIVLINLPRLSTRRDTRQQHYILLAFGFPFTLVVFVSILYAIYRLVIRIRTGPNHAKHLRSRVSWRRFSRRFRVLRDSNGHSRHRHSHSQVAQTTIKSSGNFDESELDESDECTSCEGSNEMNLEPKLYSLVTEVMQVSKQQQPRISTPMHQVFPESINSSQCIAHLNTGLHHGRGPPPHLLHDRRFSSNPPLE